MATAHLLKKPEQTVACPSDADLVLLPQRILLTIDQIPVLCVSRAHDIVASSKTAERNTCVAETYSLRRQISSPSWEGRILPR